ncbi:MAG: MoaD family protein [Planctomycetota bacterium]|jgi:molybdopterin synthase sulfur carrier subunit|nr:MoaD family protein [Planctomycetota bacterium]|tara:strand:- start:222 stop:494 length:273 start_codon:yes stop_codon:yes gene_type:complete
MSVNVTIPTPLREHTEGKDSVEVQGSTVKEVFQDLGRQYTSITDRLLDGEKVRRFVNIFVNDEDIRYLQDMDTPVSDGDTISIIPAVAGG